MSRLTDCAVGPFTCVFDFREKLLCGFFPKHELANKGFLPSSLEKEKSTSCTRNCFRFRFRFPFRFRFLFRFRFRFLFRFRFRFWLVSSLGSGSGPAQPAQPARPAQPSQQAQPASLA